VSLLVAAFGLTLRAHDAGLSTAQGELREQTLELHSGFSPADVRRLLPENVRGPEKWTPAEFAAAKDALLVLAPQLWTLRDGDAKLLPRDYHVELVASDDVSFRLFFDVTPSRDSIVFRAEALDQLPKGHRQYVVFKHGDAGIIAEKLLSAADPELSVPLRSSVSTNPPVRERPGFWGFVKLGVIHIGVGYDHLMFLFGLLVVCRTFRSILTIVTCFTLAHSLTLALATLNVIQVPTRWVEPAIAASILFVGIENLLSRGKEPRYRAVLTFGFGLIHGLGFARVLRDLGVGSAGQALALPLFSFNLGVELGQIAIAALVLPILWRLRKNEGFVERGVPILSSLIGLAGLYWLLDRTVFA
jgi:hydrogenase/urease accessory protein HupE